MAEFEDMAITGDIVKALPEEERWFEIIKAPYYEDLVSLRDENKKDRKLMIYIKLSDGRSGYYVPNRTSSRKMAVLAETNDMDKWVGMKFFWGAILQQNVFGETKQVPYITDKYPAEDKAE